ncbi:MAG: hypothetical protein GW900_07910 [Gammaproteobacteria bacterium]|nr:hypothetical protein [Gammaproteobacteria bacterium]
MYDKDDGLWSFSYPSPEQFLEPWQPRIYNSEAAELLIITYGNGVPMALRALKELEQIDGEQGRVLDLRWLKPLNVDAVALHAGQCKRILVLDEGRPDGGIGEAIVTALVERGLAGRPIRRITGKDCYIPLGDAAKLMLPDQAEVLATARQLMGV